MTTSSQKTAIIAASVLSVLAFFQLVIVLIAFARQSGPPQVALQPSTTAPAKSESDGTPVKTASAKTTPAKETPSGLGQSTETPMELAESSATPSEVDILVKRATDIRDKGDMSGTLASLRDAQKLFPDDPKIIGEFATTYEQMGLVDKSLAQWKRLMDLGEKAGDLYGVAAEKVRVGVIPKETGGRDEEGLQPGSTLGLVDVVKNYTLDPATDTEQVNLRLGIKARQNATISASSINIQAMFYDLVDNKDVEPTDPAATVVTSEWLTVPADWLDEGLEVLKVRYSQKPPAPGENPAASRKYLGYIIRVYYENELQDMTAEPLSLLKDFPPPVTLQKEIPQ